MPMCLVGLALDDRLFKSDQGVTPPLGRWTALRLTQESSLKSLDNLLRRDRRHWRARWRSELFDARITPVEIVTSLDIFSDVRSCGSYRRNPCEWMTPHKEHLEYEDGEAKKILLWRPIKRTEGLALHFRRLVFRHANMAPINPGRRRNLDAVAIQQLQNSLMLRDNVPRVYVTDHNTSSMHIHEEQCEVGAAMYEVAPCSFGEDRMPSTRTKKVVYFMQR